MLSLNAEFAPFLVNGATWLQETKAAPLRGFTGDGSLVPERN